MLAATKRDDLIVVGLAHQIMWFGQWAVSTVKQSARGSQYRGDELSSVVIGLQKATHLAGIDEPVGTGTIDVPDLS